MVVMKELKAEWVPVKVNYLFFIQDDDTRYQYIPNKDAYIRDGEEWPNCPTAEAMGFETQSLKRPTFACE